MALDHLRLSGIVTRALGKDGPLGESSKAWGAQLAGLTEAAPLAAALRELKAENATVEALLTSARGELKKQGGATKNLEYFGADHDTYPSVQLPEFAAIEKEHVAQTSLFAEESMRCAMSSVFGPELVKLDADAVKLEAAQKVLAELDAAAARLDVVLQGVPKAEKKIERVEEKVDSANERVEAAEQRLEFDQQLFPENQNGSWDKDQRKLNRRNNRLEKKQEALSGAEFDRQNAYADAYLAVGTFLKLVESKRAVLEGTTGALPLMTVGELGVERNLDQTELLVGKNVNHPDQMPAVPPGSPTASTWLSGARDELEKARVRVNADLHLNRGSRQQMIDNAVG